MTPIQCGTWMGISLNKDVECAIHIVSKHMYGG